MRANADCALAALRESGPHVREVSPERQVTRPLRRTRLYASINSNSISGGIMSKRLLRADGTNLTLLASGISAILGTGGMRAAHAQEQSGGALNDEITVTGSRIVRRDLNATSPIMTVD